MPTSDELDQLRIATQRLHGLQAVVDALHHRDEVSALIAASSDFASALVAVAQFLDTDQNGAHKVLTLHWSASTKARHQQAIEDLAEIRHIVIELRQQR